MVTTKKTGIERFNYLGERAALWAGFVLMQVILVTCLCSLFVEHDTAVYIAYVLATIITLISAVNKNIRWNVIGVSMILYLIVGVIAFFDIFEGVAHVYRIGTGR